MERRIGVSAGLGSFAVGIVLAIYEVQGWKMPSPLATAFIVLMLLMVTIAVVVILYEVGKVARRIWQQRTVSAAWISNEEPGFLDFEANLKRAQERFTSELNKLGKDTLRLGKHFRKLAERAKKELGREE